MKEYLESEISKRRSRLIALDREKVKVQAELGVYEDMLFKLAAQSGEDGEITKVKKGRAKEGYKLTPTYFNILHSLQSPHKTFNIEEFLTASEGLGHPTTPVNVRSQLSIYTEKGIIERIGIGRYRVISEALEAARPAFKNAEAPNADLGGETLGASSSNPEAQGREAGPGGGT